MFPSNLMCPRTNMKYLLGKKINMTQVFDASSGRVFPATVLTAGPVRVTDIKTKERDGYSAVQFGYGFKKASRVKKPQRKNVEGAPEGKAGFSYLREERTEGTPEVKIGDVIDLSAFAEGDKITVSGISKGRGFQGVVKRHGFHGGPRSHGQKHSEREAGSIGTAGIQRVIKGMRMPGRMGSDRVTTKSLKIVKIEEDKGLIYIGGAVPGRRGTLIEIKGQA